jgi:hypothetical protein
MRRGAATAGTVVLSVAVTLLVARALVAPQVTAQSEQPGEVRASAFVLVGADGAPRASLAVRENGAVSIQFLDGAGALRSMLGEAGLVVRDTDGQTGRLFVGLVPTGASAGSVGTYVFGSSGSLRLFSGVSPTSDPNVQVVDANGMTPRISFGITADGRSGLGVRDNTGTPRVRLGQAATGPNVNFEVTLLDADGQVIAVLP